MMVILIKHTEQRGNDLPHHGHEAAYKIIEAFNGKRYIL